MTDTMSEATNVTAEQLFTMGEGRRELVGGRVVELSFNGADHGSLCAGVLFAIHQHTSAHGLGRAYASPTGFTLRRNPDTVRAPDVAFVSKARVVRTQRYFEGAPDLVVEVLSPGDLASELRSKVRDYLDAGTRLVWILDPETRTATVHRPDGTALDIAESGALDGEDLLPGLRIELADLFAD